MTISVAVAGSLSKGPLIDWSRGAGHTVGGNGSLGRLAAFMQIHEIAYLVTPNGRDFQGWNSVSWGPNPS